MSKVSKLLSYDQKRYLDYVNSHPGCSVADIDRACRRNHQAGHKWVYDSVRRLIDRKFLIDISTSNKKKLYVLDREEYEREVNRSQEILSRFGATWKITSYVVLQQPFETAQIALDALKEAGINARIVCYSYSCTKFIINPPVADSKL